VVAANDIGGYGGGRGLKQKLLTLEGRFRDTQARKLTNRKYFQKMEAS
jgi:hypothetical protein